VVVSHCFVDGRDWRGRGGWEGDCEELPKIEGLEITVRKCQFCDFWSGECVAGSESKNGIGWL
jgi:hypothetical protein